MLKDHYNNQPYPAARPLEIVKIQVQPENMDHSRRWVCDHGFPKKIKIGKYSLKQTSKSIEIFIIILYMYIYKMKKQIKSFKDFSKMRINC